MNTILQTQSLVLWKNSQAIILASVALATLLISFFAQILRNDFVDTEKGFAGSLGVYFYFSSTSLSLAAMSGIH